METSHGDGAYPAKPKDAHGGYWDSLRLPELVPGTDPLANEVLLGRQALHARRLRFTHPRRNRIIEAEAPPTNNE